MNPAMGASSQGGDMNRVPKHNHAAIKNEAARASRVLPMRACSRSSCASLASRSRRRAEYRSLEDTNQCRTFLGEIGRLTHRLHEAHDPWAS